MTKFFILFFTFISSLIYSQVTLRIVKIPKDTPSDSSIYFAGSLNNWNPASEDFNFKADENGLLSITFPEGNGIVEFKITRGNWENAEGDMTGNKIQNRHFTFSGNPQIIDITVESWENNSIEKRKSTASINVKILADNFYIPQLDRYRKIWLYLPPDYYKTHKKYPVLYMQDGQNLFDDVTSYSGEWHIDETLNSQFTKGDYGAIVVGIENGTALRIDEYSPWENEKYGGGEGDKYVDFIANTLKPYIDSNFRTKKRPSHNALIGSSLGALISTYATIKYHNKFEKTGNLSPAYWFVLKDLNTYILSNTKNLKKVKMYFVAGQKESSEIVSDINTVKKNLLNMGVLPNNILVKIDPDGVHNESYWSREFANLYQWLFPKK